MAHGRAVLPGGWQPASLDGHGAAAVDPLDGAPDWAKREVFEGRQRNLVGLCFREGCGRPLADDTACAAHGDPPAGAPRPGAPAGRRPRRHW